MEEKWQLHSRIPVGVIPRGQRHLLGCSPWSREGLDRTEHTQSEPPCRAHNLSLGMVIIT